MLIRRYKESRRRHPMDPNDITAGIAKERQLLNRLRDQARYVVDTSSLLPRQLGDLLWGMFSGQGQRDTILPIIVSFGYKNGIPLDADLVFDVRILPNPFYDPELKQYDGLQQPIHDFVYGFEVTQVFEDKLMELLPLPHALLPERGQIPAGHRHRLHRRHASFRCGGGKPAPSLRTAWYFLRGPAPRYREGRASELTKQMGQSFASAMRDELLHMAPPTMPNAKRPNCVPAYRFAAVSW